MNHIARRIGRPLVLAGALALAGCSEPSAWQQSFVRESDTPALPALPKDAPVRVRSVPWERMQYTLGELQQEVVASDVNPDDWSPEQKAKAKSRLLRGLQVSENPERVEIIGSSEFRTTQTLRPDGADQPALAAFARSIGATDVVWAARDLGKTQTVVDKPITSSSSGTFWGANTRRNGWWGNSYYSQNSTTWVPVTVIAEETGFYAYYLRMQ